MDTPTTETQATPETAQEAPQKNWSQIASEAFGNSYHGEVSESQEVSQESLEQPLEADDAELSAEAEQQEVSEAETQQEETPISSFSELIDHYQLDPEWLDSLELGVKVNGQEGKAKFADIKNSYQTMQAAEQRLSDAKERARTELQAVAEKREQINSTFAVTASLVENLEKKIVGDESKINWEKLRNDDPAEWTAKRADFAERRQEVEKIKQDAVSSYQSNQSQIAQESEQAQQQYLQEQQQMLMEKLPEWKDPQVAKADKTAVAEYLLEQGFGQKDIEAASDHRMILLARKAMLYDKGRNKAEVTQKKITKIPKVIKPGAPKSAQQNAAEQQSRIKSKLRQSGSIDDAVALLRARKG